MTTRNHIPCTVAAGLDARLSPFHLDDESVRLMELGAPQPTHPAEPPPDRQLKMRLVDDLKLLFAALGAGGSAVPLGDNGRTARLLSSYAASLRRR
jgi:hypothetical protein